jgi:hypothetical protein
MNGDPVVPATCDGCGRSAAACRMSELGWAVRLPGAGCPGAYCYECSQLLELLRRSIECDECGRRIEDDEAAERDGWRYFYDSTGTLTPYCAECVEDELAF